MDDFSPLVWLIYALMAGCALSGVTCVVLAALILAGVL